jgi:hypothetical protein
MLTIERAPGAIAWLGNLPFLAIVGIAVMVAGGVLDVIVHLGPAHDHATGGAHLEEHMAHLIGMVGMVITWAGVVGDGIRRQLRRSPAEGRSSPDAIR